MMDIQAFFKLAIPMVLAAVTVSHAAVLSDEARLIDDLLTNYNSQAKPTLKASTPTIVSAMFSLGRIESLKEKDQILTTFGWVMLIWQDELLRWDPSAYGGTQNIVLAGTEIWLPEFSLFNGVNQGNDLAYEAKFRAKVHSSGMVQWGPGFKWETSCDMDLTYFPWDTHECQVSFVNWMYGKDLLQFTVGSAYEVNTQVLKKNGEWKLLNATQYTDKMEVELNGMTFKVPRVSFTLRLERIPTFYLWNMVIPCLLMTFLGTFMFITPSEAGEKIGLAVTILLGFTVILLMISDITPKSGDTMPMLTQYIVFSMGLTTICLLATLGVLNLHHHRPCVPVPAWLCRPLLHGMARVVFLHRPELCRCPSKGAVTPVQDIHINEKTPRAASDGSLLPADVIAYIRKKMADDEEEDVVSQNKLQWEHAANVMDRCLLLVSFIVITIMSLTYLFVISTGQK